MKTLDEVIESITTQSGLEIKNVRKPEKDRFWVDRETYMDALQYLKAYRSDQVQWAAERKGYEDWIDQYKDARDKHQKAVIACKQAEAIYRQKQKAAEDVLWQMTDPDADRQQLEKARALLQDFYRNDPLTWDELREMAGKPVWLVHPGTESSEWVFVGEWFDDDEMRFYRMGHDDADHIAREFYENGTWQAYRKERP